MRSASLALLAVLAAALPSAGQDAPRDQARALEQQMRKVIEGSEPSVVAVVASQLKYPPSPVSKSTPGQLGTYVPPAPPPLAALPPAQARLDLSNPDYVADHQFGSGLVVEANYDAPTPVVLVLTNAHLIDGATKVYVRGVSGKGCYADIHASDARSDLAVLKLLDPPPGLKPARFADVRVIDGPGAAKATVYRGLWVIALGHPMAAGAGDGVPSASWGIVSGVRRRAAGPPREEDRYRTTRGLHHYSSLIQTDARITLGASGGTLFDLDGRAVGLTAPLAAVTGSDTAGGFAVPFDQNYTRIIDVLKKGREVEYGFLGVSLGRKVPDLGVALDAVTPGGPADRAGMAGSSQFGDRPNLADVITRIDGHPVRDTDDIFQHIGAALAGSKVLVTVRRGSGRERDVTATLVKHHNAMPWLASVPSPDLFGLRVDYPSVLIGLNETRQIEDGVLVRGVVPNSAAATKLGELLTDGQPRWLVTQVDGRPVATPADLFREAQGKKSVHLRLHAPKGAPDERDREVRLP